MQSSNILLDWRDYLPFSTTFIESGSCYGRTVELALKAGFQRVKSVEYKPEFYEHCQKLFAGNQRVSLYLGKSVDRLAEMLEDVSGPAVIWLDAHVSGEASGGYQDWLEKQEQSDFDQNNILTKELEIVFAHRKDHIILIDDQNGVNEFSLAYAAFIQSQADYECFFIDEQMGETFYKDKILVAIPK
jgi:hypothetical protein